MAVELRHEKSRSQVVEVLKVTGNMVRVENKLLGLQNNIRFSAKIIINCRANQPESFSTASSQFKMSLW